MKKDNLSICYPYLFTFIVLVFICLNLNGQNKTYSDTTYYYSKNIKSIYTINGDNKTETIYFENGNLKTISNFYKNNFNGLQQRWYENGKQLSKSNYENDLITHKTEWYSNGGLKNIENYIYLEIENKRKAQLYHGEYLHYYENGNIKTKGQYDSGLMINQWETFYENGQNEMITNYSNGLKNGNETKWYRSGLKQFECTYISILNNGIQLKHNNVLDNISADFLKRQGPNGNNYNSNQTVNYITFYSKKRIQYHENGKKSLEYNYKNGLREGTCKEWHNNGKLKSLIEYKNNQINGKNYYYFYNGKPQYINKRIETNKYPEKFEGIYEAYYADGSPKTFCNYKKGKLNGLYTTYYENGNKERETNYINGLKTGEDKYWYFNGKIKKIETYRVVKIKDSEVSQLEGEVISYNNNGIITEKSIYSNGKLNGLKETWHENGKKYSEIDYCNDERCGIEKKWDYKGNITSEKKYIQSKENKNTYITAYTKEFKDSILSAYRLFNANGNEYKTNQYYANGKLKFTTHSLSHRNSHYTQSAISRTINYFENGNIESDKFILNDLEQGTSFSYYIDGSPRLYKYNEIGDDSFEIYINWAPSGQLLSHQNRAKDYVDINDIKLEKEVFKLMVDYQKNKPQNPTADISETWQNSNKLIEIKETNDSTLNYNAFYFNGKPFFAIQFKQHIPHGNYSIWEYNGVKLEEGQFYNGKKINHWVFKSIENKLEKEISYTLKDESEGLYKGFNYGGTLVEEYTFKNYSKNGKRTTYYDDGKLHTEEYYKNGSRDSIAKTFNKNGDLIEYSEYDNIGKAIISKQWTDNGILTSEIIYKPDIRLKTYNKWWNNGNVKIKGYYQNYAKDSIWSFYNSEGKLIVQEQYKRNETYPIVTYNASLQCRCKNAPLIINKETPTWQKANEYNKLRDIKCLETLYNNQNKEKVYFTNYLTKKENNETISTFNLQIKEPVNTRLLSKSQLILNPCFSFENHEVEIPCTTQINDNAANITMQPKKLAIYFNYSLLREKEASNLKNQISELSYYSNVSKLLFSVSSMAANSKKTTLNTVENTCFMPSYIGYSNIQLALDSAKISMNSEFSTQEKPKFNYNIINNFKSYLYNNITNNYSYNETGSIEIFSNKAIYTIPNRFFDTAFKDTSTFVNSNVLIQDQNLYGSVALKVQKVNDNVYSALIGNKNTAIDLKQLKEKFETYGFKNFNTYFDPTKNELSLFFNYTSNN